MIAKLNLGEVAYLKVLVHHLVDDDRTGSVEETIKIHVRVPVTAPVLLLLPDGVRHPAGVVVPHVAQVAAGQPPHRRVR